MLLRQVHVARTPFTHKPQVFRRNAQTVGGVVKVINPAIEEVVEIHKMHTPADIASKFNKAKVAQQKWRFLPLHFKKQIFAVFKKKLAENKDRLASILSTEMGKPLNQAKGEINATVGRVNWFLENVDAALEDDQVNETPNWSAVAPNQLQEIIRYEPLGVLANISAWNYPYFVGSNVFVPGLLSGNAVLYKPSEHALLTGLALEVLLRESGLPDDLFQVIVGDGQVGAEMLKMPVAGVFFTGSYPTGQRITDALHRKVLANDPKGWIRTQLELGGKDPAYVRRDANLSHAIPSLVEGAFYNTGQSCCSVERIYVDFSIYSYFVREFVNKAQQMCVVGHPSSPNTFIGPLARKEQIPVLVDQVRDALLKGAKLLMGGKPTSVDGKGYYFEPTVLVDCNHTMKVMQDESFGPIIGIQSVGTGDMESADTEAVSLMNDSEYGLTASVYSLDLNKANSILSLLETGTAYWNTSDRVSPYLPWSGRRHSGTGVTLSVEGIRTFTHPRAWHLISNPK